MNNLTKSKIIIAFALTFAILVTSLILLSLPKSSGNSSEVSNSPLPQATSSTVSSIPEQSNSSDILQITALDSYSDYPTAYKEVTDELTTEMNNELAPDTVESLMNNGMSFDDIFLNLMPEKYGKYQNMLLLGNDTNTESTEEETNELYNDCIKLIGLKEYDKTKYQIDEKLIDRRFTHLYNYKIGALYSDINLLKEMEGKEQQQKYDTLSSYRDISGYLTGFSLLASDYSSKVILDKGSICPEFYNGFTIEKIETREFSEIVPEYDEISKLYENYQLIYYLHTVVINMTNNEGSIESYTCKILELAGGNFEVCKIEAIGASSFKTVAEILGE